MACTRKDSTSRALIVWLGSQLAKEHFWARWCCAKPLAQLLWLMSLVSQHAITLFQTQNFGRHRWGFTLKELDLGSLKHMWHSIWSSTGFWHANLYFFLLELHNLGDAPAHSLNIGHLNLVCIRGGLSLQDFSSVKGKRSLNRHYRALKFISALIQPLQASIWLCWL